MMVSRGGAVGRRGWGGLVASVGWWAPVGVWELYCDAFGIICGNSRGWMLLRRIRFMVREIKIFFFLKIKEVTIIIIRTCQNIYLQDLTGAYAIIVE